MRSSFKHIMLFVLVCSTFLAVGQSESEIIKNKQRVNYIYNFTNYVTWDFDETKTIFQLGLLGDADTLLWNEFREVADEKRIKNLPVSIKLIQSPDDIENVDLVYIYKSYATNIAEILPKMYEEKALLVTEGYPFHVSMINFIEIDNEFQFEVNEEQINQASLLVDPTLSDFSIQSTVDWDELYERLQLEIQKTESQQKELNALASKIEKQKLAIATQEKHLEQTIADLKEKESTVSLKDDEIKKQQLEIEKQMLKLKLLMLSVAEQSDTNKALQETYQFKLKEVEDQNSRMNQQDSVLILNQEEILAQQQLIQKQSQILGEQESNLEKQQLISWILVLFGLSATVFIFFIILANKRRKRSEEALIEKNQELEALNDSLDSFTYRVSHDLKAPITNITSLLGLVKKYTEDNDNPIIPQLFDNLDRSTERLENTVSDLLELSRIERIDEVKEKVDLQKLMNNLLDEFKNELEQIGAQVNLKLDQPFVFASETELKSVMQNLFTNSVKYRSEKRPLQITVSSSSEHSECHVVFKDNGIGIDLKKHKEKLFGMFQRFTGNSKISGTGVGMYIIKKLIEKNNGKLQLEGGLDKGLTYLIQLPLHK